ncbi:MAG: M23 family metallopeptidase [Methylobacteriaceae bacterium]|nr:M23 family metallopeptidase [Methylobacteriaceae bacterium]
MSRRDSFPKPREYSSHYSLILSRGERTRTFKLRPGVFVGAIALIPLLALGCLIPTLLFVFRDDLLASLMSRQAEMQYAYEDQLASMHTQIERMRSRELLNEQAYEGRLHDLFQRQAQLETRASLVAALAQRASIGADVTATNRKPQSSAQPSSQEASVNPLLSQKLSSALGLPQAAMSFAPIEANPLFAKQKPHPDAMELRLAPHSEPSELPSPGRQSRLAAPVDPEGAVASLDVAFPTRLTIAASALDRLERKQVETLAQMRAPALATAERLRIALAATGLSSERLIPPGDANKSLPQGGPFIPVDTGPPGSAFAREFSRVQEAMLAVDRLRRVLPYVPVRQPLPGEPGVTSGFGVRVDPFLGRPAMHSGIDLRDDYGAPVRATAAGRVVTAEWTGGYGNMVEIDHGNGIATRYGHLSAIAVRQGDGVQAGSLLGRIGSTGRATGPHLHYEVRIDDEAVDPSRFLRAAAKLASSD